MRLVSVAVSAALYLALFGIVSGRYLAPRESELSIKNDSYITAETFITMRDGAQLWTLYSLPASGQTFACVLHRTPYGASVSGMSNWLNEGFAVMSQDQRGSGDSSDYFQFWRYDGQDGYDTMEWISQQSWSNGRVFTLGASADGNAVYAGLLLSPPWIRAMAPVVATGNGHSTAYQGGAFRNALVQTWLLGLGHIRTLQDVKENEAFGPWWDSVTLEGKEDSCNIPGVHSAGWFDIFQNENIDAFNACQYISTSPGARGQQKLVVDPHGHCNGGDYDWPNGRIDLPSDLRLALFLQENDMPIPEPLQRRIRDILTITLYIMGPADAKTGNYWTTLADWPTKTNVIYYLQGDRTLKTTLPPANSNNTRTAYVYDPDNFVRTIGGPELTLPCGPRDQSNLESRQDVITFTSAVLTQDLAIVGDMEAWIYVSSDALCTDFTVKITDVYPDGQSMLLTDGIIRMKWRDSKEVPVHMTPNTIYRVKVHLWKTAFVFNQGHAIRVAISSSNHPRFEKNPNNGLLINEDGPNVIANNVIYHSNQYPSYVTLPVVNLADIPENYNP